MLLILLSLCFFLQIVRAVSWKTTSPCPSILQFRTMSPTFLLSNSAGTMKQRVQRGRGSKCFKPFLLPMVLQIFYYHAGCPVLSTPVGTMENFFLCLFDWLAGWVGGFVLLGTSDLWPRPISVANDWVDGDAIHQAIESFLPVFLLNCLALFSLKSWWQMSPNSEMEQLNWFLKLPIWFMGKSSCRVHNPVWTSCQLGSPGLPHTCQIYINTQFIINYGD